MCGIAGIAGDAAEDEHRVRRMCDRLQHRGPDRDGFHFEPGRVALGFRRLSIIDLAGGDQPLSSEDGEVVVTCNGEIYNFRELREGLVARGHRFGSGSDVEVIAHLYEEDGVDCLHQLQGMFAIALWDRRRQALVLARDRLGVKPLYWAQVPGGLIYGSEPLALLASGLIQAAPDPRALVEYLTLQYVQAPRTGFAGMHKLAPGEVLEFRDGQPHVRRWWSLPVSSREPAMDVESAVRRTDELVGDATRSRLVADVPIGAFLSGGLDSSLVVSYMAEATAQVRTFSIDFGVAAFSEGEYARRVAAIYGTDHDEYVVEPDIIPLVADVVRGMGEPFADSSAIPTYVLSQMTRRQVTVALSGDGGDETFGGYVRYRLAMQADRIGPAARLAARLGSAVLPGVLTARRPRMARGLDVFACSSDERYAAIMSHFSPKQLRALCRPEFLVAGGGANRPWAEILRPPSGPVGVNRYLALDIDTYLPGDLLPKVDRMSMAHSLEVRSPFLDYRVQEFAAGLPGRLKIRGTTTKWLLKQVALRRGLPDDIVHRPKQGFGVPLAEWFRGDLRGWVRDILLDPATRGRGYFHPEAVERLIDEHERRAVDHWTRLWNLIMLELWHRAYIDG